MSGGRAAARRARASARRLAGALAHCRAGRLDRAEAQCRAILRTRPRDVDALHLLGLVLHQAGRGAEGIEHLERAVGLAPGDAGVALALADALTTLGRGAEALPHLERAVALAPGSVAARVNLADALVAAGRPAEALPHLRAALEAEPGLAQAHFGLGRVLDALGDRGEALACHERAAALAPGWPEAHAAAGRLALARGEPDRAVAPFARARDLEPARAARWRDLGQALTEAGRLEEAWGAFAEAARLEPGDPESRVGLGVCRQLQGRFEEAARLHREALARDPGDPRAWFQLSLLPGGVPAGADLEPLRRRLGEGGAGSALGHFALGHLHDRRGRHDEAFAHFEAANRIEAAAAPFAPERFSEYVDRLIEVFDEAWFRGPAPGLEPAPAPIFIVGMPRSGSTLIERILARHPAVVAAGEHDELRRMVRDLPRAAGGDRPFPEAARDLSPDALAALGRRYLDSLAPAARGAPRFTDKLLGNFLRLGLAARLFPRAVVVECRRDPRDVALSCYFHRFAHGLRFTYDLGHIASVQRDQRRLMAHWRRVLPLPVVEVSYEALVRDPRVEIRRLVEACGLAWDPRCATPEAGGGDVRTASFWQARQPVYASSVGRWRAYARYLEPHRAALEAAVEGGDR